MNFNEYFNLGVISKVFSFKGEVILRIDVNYPEILANLQTIFIEQGDTLVPYLIEDLSFQKQNFLKAKLKGINNEDQAKAIVRCNIYLPDSFLPKLNKDEFYFHEIEGYEIYDQNNKLVGKVSTVYDLPSNPLVATMHNKKEVLLPLNLLIEVHKAEKKLILEIPEGIFDL